MEFNYPSPGFYFQVCLGPETFSFKEVSGIGATITYEDIKSGGEDGLVYKAFKQMNYTNLELKRGFVPKNSFIGIIIDSMVALSVASKLSNGFPMVPLSSIFPLVVNLLDENGMPAYTWVFYNPILEGWQISGFDAMKNDYLTETITISYSDFIVFNQ